jgi:hypothetical protein
MTEDTMADEPKNPTKAEADKLQKLADAFEKDGTIEPGYQFRYVTTGGNTVLVVEPIERKG